MASDPDQEYMYFMGSETRTIDYIPSDESSIPFYSSGYKNQYVFER